MGKRLKTALMKMKLYKHSNPSEQKFDLAQQLVYSLCVLKCPATEKKQRI